MCLENGEGTIALATLSWILTDDKNSWVREKKALIAEDTATGTTIGGLRIDKTVLRKNNTVGGITLPSVKAYDTAAVIHGVVLAGGRDTGQRTRTEDPEIDTHQYAH